MKDPKVQAARRKALQEAFEAACVESLKMESKAEYYRGEMLKLRERAERLNAQLQGYEI